MTKQEGRGLGNYLYYWLHAYLKQVEGQDFRVLYAPGMEPWLQCFPAIREDLIIAHASVRPGDTRDPSTGSICQHFGHGFMAVALRQAVLAPPRSSGQGLFQTGLTGASSSFTGLLGEFAPIVEYLPAEDSAQANLHAVATAQRLVGTNSTFGYWGGYLSNVLYGTGSQVVMPGFHARHIKGGKAIQLDPSWDIIGEIPGGWDA